MAPFVSIEKSGAVAILRLEKPPVNAVDTAFALEIEAAVAQLEKDAPGAVILTGSGRCFSAGLDLKAVPSYSREQQKDLIRAFDRLLMRLYGFASPLIASLNGHAIAGGFILALCCDYRICIDEPVQLGLTEARVGIPFPASAAEIIKAELPATVCRRLALTGKNYNPSEMLQWGIIDEICAPHQFTSRIIEVASDFSTIPPIAYRKIKHQLRKVTLERIASSSEPDLSDWLSSETESAARKILQDRG